ncbi:MAG: radical SAM protein [Candidatus Omnitrophota bacterium]
MSTIIRKTKSRCLKCGSIVPAAVIKKEGKVFLEKNCPEHNFTSLLISDNASSYEDLERYYFTVMPDNARQESIEIAVTFRCNMDCPICAWGTNYRASMNNAGDPSLLEIREFLKTNDTPVVRLSGGEATCREDLTEVIRMVKKMGKAVGISTNGLKIADFDYLKQLKEAGLDEIYLTLDGFDPDVEKFMRAKDYLPFKMRALDNLKKLNIITGLNMRILKGINEAEIPKIIDYVAKNSFIKLLNIGTVNWAGNASSWSLDKYLMPDQLIDIVVDTSSGKLNRNAIRTFQKLLLAVNSFFSKRWCFYDAGNFLIIRQNGQYESLEKHLDLQALEKVLNRYAVFYERNVLLAKLYLIFAGIGSIRFIKSKLFFKEILVKGLGFISGNRDFLKTDSFLFLLMHTACDSYKIDYGVSKNCMTTFAFKGTDGILRVQGNAAQVCESLSDMGHCSRNDK